MVNMGRALERKLLNEYASQSPAVMCPPAPGTGSVSPGDTYSEWDILLNNARAFALQPKYFIDNPDYSVSRANFVEKSFLSDDDKWDVLLALPYLPQRLNDLKNQKLMMRKVAEETRKIEADILETCKKMLIGKRNVKRIKVSVATGEYEYRSLNSNYSRTSNSSNSSHGGGGGNVDVMWGLVKVGGSGGGGSSSSSSYSNSNSYQETHIKLRPTGLKSFEIEFFEDK